MAKLLLGSLLAAIAMFLWGFFYWVVLPLDASTTRPFTDEQRDALVNMQLKRGFYVYPHDSQLNDELESGPFIELSYSPITTYFDVQVLTLGFAHYFAAAILAGILMTSVRESLRSYSSRVSFGFIFGITAVFLLTLGDPIWFHRSWNYALVASGYQLGLALILGLIMGKFI